MRTSMFLARLSITLCGAACLAFAQAPCERLKSLALSDTTFTAVETVAAGPFQPPPGAPQPARGPGAPQPAGRGGGPQAGGRGPAPVPQMLPAYCRVAATLKPSADSEIKMEAWLPIATWNGKFQMVGNGGWAGTISFAAMAGALREGYATASTDTGHEGGNGMFALGHPEKIVDFGWRAVHETVVKSKALIQAFYDSASKYSYWNGCSTGGRQALVEVTKFPNDFDGVLAGAPANPHIHLHAAGVERSIEMMKNPQGALSPGKVETLHKAVMAACDALDGVKDGLIGDPHKCHFDAASLLCQSQSGETADSDACLTPAQVQTVKTVFADVKTRKGEIVWTGFEPGGELQYAALRTVPTQPGGGWDSIRILGHQDADFDFHKFDLDTDLALADQSGIDAHTFDLSPFKAHGGKLLMYHGWADQLIAPGNTVNFYNGVLGKMGRKQDDWLRLFMVPGMMHCSGGPGTDQFNKMAVLERWREAGTAPEQIVAAHIANGQVDMTRPLCPYPQVAVYKGTGTTNDAANFVCKIP
ncbi:MAG TPA: tannase/feruloyl esterase family alpha/beta hydrolase [Candidatus Acidoferrales bacterium]|nr:tannase/feruloyl esterase family alpha/beta hydrolase [Candidatus Acidoferrales bacterium]